MSGQGPMTAQPDARAERMFYIGMAALLCACVFLGFSRSFFLHAAFPAHPVPPERFFLFHGALFTAWMLILAAQPLLVTAGRRDLHRALGRAGAVVALVMVGSGLYGSLVAAARPGGFVGIPVPPLQFLVVPLFDITLFATFVLLALGAVRDPQAHKRWMLIATVCMMGAAIARWPFAAKPPVPVFFGIQDLLLLPLLLWDLRSRGRPHPVTLAGLGVLVLSQPLRLLLSGTDTWLAFAATLVALVR